MPDRLLYLVRHAEVIVTDDVPSTEWPLSARGRAAARELAAAREWRTLSLVASSPEPKARDTAAPIAQAAGVELRVEQDLREVGRGETPVVTQAEYFALVAAHFAGDDVPGWETAPAARERVTACIGRLARETEEPLCVVSHALLLSHYLASVLGLDRPDFEQWRAIPHPAVAVVDPTVPRVVARFEPLGRFLGR